MAQTWRRSVTAHLKTPAKWLAIVTAALSLSVGIILLVLGLYHANSGTARYNLSYDRTQDINFACGTQTPQLNLSGPGMLIFHGEPQPMQAIHVYGAARPQLTTNASNADIENAATGDPEHVGTITQSAFTATCRGYALKAGGLIYGVALFVIGGVLLALRFLRHDLVKSWVKFSLVTAVTLTGVLAGQAALTAIGTQPLFHVKSPAAVFAYSGLRTIPPPASVQNPNAIIGVNGNSIFSGYNGTQPVANPTPNDKTCERTRSDLASQLATLAGVPVLDAPCPGADVDMGFFDQEMRHGRLVASQISLDEAAPNIQAYVLNPGMNSVGWGLLAGAAKLTDANIPLVPVSITAAIAHLQPFMDDALSVYRSRPGHPQVIVVGSYKAFPDGMDLSSCSDAKGYSPDEIALLNQQVDRINEFLKSWAADKGVAYVQPDIQPLCTKDTTSMGPDIIGMASKYRFHLTPKGILKIAMQVYGQMHLRPLAPGQPASAVTPGVGPLAQRYPPLFRYAQPVG